MGASIGAKLKAAGIKKPSGPVWRGPEQDGITFSLLSRFLVDRERFRLLVVEGVKPADRFSKHLEYGNLWHVCEEAFAKKANAKSGQLLWDGPLAAHANQLLRKYPFDREQVEKWYEVCKRQFPEYVRFHQHRPDVVARTPLLQEREFCVPYRLTSGRTVKLRGKWDSVDLIDAHEDEGVRYPKGIWLMENKSKGEVDEPQLKQQLTFDLQTCIYLIALQEATKGGRIEQDVMRFLQSNPILGVRYNVVRRPLSGGKGTIVQGKGTQGSKCPKCKGSCTVVNVAFGENRRMQCPKCGGKGRVGGKPAETKEAYYDRLAKYIRDEPATYFFRWKVAVGPRDVERFRRECLDPILEQLCWWWDSVTCKIDPKHNRLSDLIASLNFRMPYGVWNPLLEGNATEYDEFLRTGNAMGLQKVTDLFPELKEGKP